MGVSALYTLNMMNTLINTFKLPSPEGMLVGRDAGKRMFESCLSFIDAEGKGGHVALDFSDVKFVDFSSADEFLGRLAGRILSRELGDTCVLLTHCKPEVCENIDAMLRLKNQAMLCKESSGNIRLLGKLHPQLEETLKFVDQRGEVTARDLADAEKIAINTSSNRLTKLGNLGLLGRKEEPAAGKGGKQYRYFSLTK
jgi:hypothetical protein